MSKCAGVSIQFQRLARHMLLQKVDTYQSCCRICELLLGGAMYFHTYHNLLIANLSNQSGTMSDAIECWQLRVLTTCTNNLIWDWELSGDGPAEIWNLFTRNRIRAEIWSKMVTPCLTKFQHPSGWFCSTPQILANIFVACLAACRTSLVPLLGCRFNSGPIENGSLRRIYIGGQALCCKRLQTR